MNTVYRGCFINPISDNKIDFYKDGLLFVEKGGKIKELCSTEKYNLSNLKNLVELKDEKGNLATVIPGFCDTHFHWVQDLVSDMEKANLLAWLDEYVFPEEGKFKEKSYCEERGEKFFDKLIRSGTTSGAIYSSIHTEAIDSAFSHKKGNFLVGNVVMTNNSPEFLTCEYDNVVSQVNELAKKYKESYVITPRFALSCNPTIMKELGKIANENNLYVQTHLSETKNEIESTLGYYKTFDGFENVSSYLDIYLEANLVSEKTIFGHCIHLTENERKIIKETGAKIAHCPTSNAPIEDRGLGSGLFDYIQATKDGIDWALASDIGAGPYISMFDVMKSFVSQNEQIGRKPSAGLALYRATRKGAEILGLKNYGGLEKGMFASFVVLNSKKLDSAEEILNSYLENKRENMNTLPIEVYLDGKKVI